MPTPKVTDLDALLNLDEDDGPITTRPVKLFGKQWTIICDLNFWNITTAASTADGLSALILGVIAEDQREDFTNEMRKIQHLTPEKLMKIIEAIMEVAAERPTTQPSASTRGAGSKTSARKSVAPSSRTGAARSRR